MKAKGVGADDMLNTMKSQAMVATAGHAEVTTVGEGKEERRITHGIDGWSISTYTQKDVTIYSRQFEMNALGSCGGNVDSYPGWSTRVIQAVVDCASGNERITFKYFDKCGQEETRLIIPNRSSESGSQHKCYMSDVAPEAHFQTGNPKFKPGTGWSEMAFAVEILFNVDITTGSEVCDWTDFGECFCMPIKDSDPTETRRVMDDMRSRIR